MTASRRPRASPFLRRLRLWDRRVQRGIFPPDVLVALWERNVETARKADASEAGELSAHLASILQVLLAGRIATVEEDARNVESVDSAGLRSDLASLWSDLVATQQLVGTDPAIEPALGRLTRLQASVATPVPDARVPGQLSPPPRSFRDVGGAAAFSAEIVHAWWNGRHLSFADSSTLSRFLAMPLAPLDEFDAQDEAMSGDVEARAFDWSPQSEPSSTDIRGTARAGASTRRREPRFSPRVARSALKRDFATDVLARRSETRVPAVGFTQRLVGKTGSPFGVEPVLPAQKARSFLGDPTRPRQSVGLAASVAAGASVAKSTIPPLTVARAISPWTPFANVPRDNEAVRADPGKSRFAERVPRLGPEPERVRGIQRSSSEWLPARLRAQLDRSSSGEGEPRPGRVGQQWPPVSRLVDGTEAIDEQSAFAEGERQAFTASSTPTVLPYHQSDVQRAAYSVPDALDANALDETVRMSTPLPSKSFTPESSPLVAFARSIPPAAVKRQMLSAGRWRPVGPSLGEGQRRDLRSSSQRLDQPESGAPVGHRRLVLLAGQRSTDLQGGSVSRDSAGPQSPARGVTRGPPAHVPPWARQAQIWQPGSRLSVPIVAAGMGSLSHRGTPRLPSPPSPPPLRRETGGRRGGQGQGIPSAPLVLPQNTVGSGASPPAITARLDVNRQNRVAQLFARAPIGRGRLDSSRWEERFFAPAESFRSALALPVGTPDLDWLVGPADEHAMGIQAVAADWLANQPTPLRDVPRSRISNPSRGRAGWSSGPPFSTVQFSEALGKPGDDALGEIVSVSRGRGSNRGNASAASAPAVMVAAGVGKSGLGSLWLQRNQERRWWGLRPRDTRGFGRSSALVSSRVFPGGAVSIVSAGADRGDRAFPISAGQTSVRRRGHQSGRPLSTERLLGDSGSHLQTSINLPLIGASNDFFGPVGIDQVKTSRSSLVNTPLTARRGLLSARRDDAPNPLLLAAQALAFSVEHLGNTVSTSGDRRRGGRPETRTDHDVVLPRFGRPLGPEGTVVVPSILSRWSGRGRKADVTLPVAPTFVFDLPELAPNAESPRAKPGLTGSPPTALGSAWMPKGEVTVSGGPATLTREVFTRSLGIGARNRRSGVADISVAARDMAVPKSQVDADLFGGSQTAAARSLPFVDVVLQESRSDTEFSGSDHVSRTRLSNGERLVQNVEPFRRPGSVLIAPWMARSAVGTEHLDREGHETTRKRTKPERTSDVFRSLHAVSWRSQSTGLNRLSGEHDLSPVGDDPGRTGLAPEATFGRSVPLLPVRDPWLAFSLREGDESAGSARTNSFRQGHVQTSGPGAVSQARVIDGSTSFAFVRVPNEATVVVPRQGPVIGPHRMLRLSHETRLLGGEARRTMSRADSAMPIDRRRPDRAFETVQPTGVLPRDALRGAAELTRVRARRHDDFLSGGIDSLAIPLGQSAAQFAFTVERRSGNEEPIARRAGRQIANPGGLLPLAMAGPIDQTGEVGPRRRAAETPELERSRATSVAASSPGEVARRTASSYSPGTVLPLVSQSASHGSPAVAAAGSGARTTGATITPHSSAASTKSTVVQRFSDGSEAESNPSMGSTDLDTLARQVYAMLKQRLVVERERIGLRGGRRSW